MKTQFNFSEIPTPFYLYDLDLLHRTANIAAREAGRYGYKVHYAIKANHESPVLEVIRRAGFGIDCVSGNEVEKALMQGFDADQITFAGVGKTDQEILTALENQIFSLNCESLEELEVIAELALKKGRQANVALRVNPGIDANTHKLITTGLHENKFGIPLDQLGKALQFCQENQSIKFIGLHFHIGSQITRHEPFEKLCRKASEIWRVFDISSYGGSVLNLGGGLGIHYEDPVSNPVPDFPGFFRLVAGNLDTPPEVNIHFELGRSLVGQCGSLVTRVLYVKKGEEKIFLVTDAGMTELLRPALYNAFHKIENISARGPEFPYDVVGPICESSDVFAKGILLPQSSRGDILFIRSCGAYAQSMSLRYNLRTPAPAFYILKNQLCPNPSFQNELSNPVVV